MEEPNPFLDGALRGRAEASAEESRRLTDPPGLAQARSLAMLVQQVVEALREAGVPPTHPQAEVVQSPNVSLLQRPEFDYTRVLERPRLPHVADLWWTRVDSQDGEAFYFGVTSTGMLARLAGAGAEVARLPFIGQRGREIMATGSVLDELALAQGDRNEPLLVKKATKYLPYGESSDFWAFDSAERLLTALVESVSRRPKM
jgi:hypothetical protein